MERNDDVRYAETDAEQAGFTFEDVEQADPEGGDVTPETEEIRADIEVTRVEMGGTLRELGDRLDPGNLVNEAKENVREATIGRVEETAKGMSDMVMETIRRNPIPAAMAGAGLALLWMNRSDSTSAGDGNRRAGAYEYRYGDSYRRSGEGYGMDSRTGVADRARDAAAGVGENVSGAVGHVGETIGEVGQNVGTTVGQGVDQASWRLERLMESSPLAMGAIALGAGAVIGALVPETPHEERMLGDASRAVGETVRDTVAEATDRAESEMGRLEQSAPSPAGG
jgi:hypothetical protein